MPSPAQRDPQLSAMLQERLEEIRLEFGLPALWAARYHEGKDGKKIYLSGVSGIRKQGESATAQLSDPVHLGSCTKAMTALLIAQAVSSGEIAWNDRLAELLPSQPAIADSPWSEVTVLQLMRQRSGCPTKTPWHSFHNQHPDDVIAARRAMVGWLVKQSRPEKPGYNYSNLNYALLGHILEVKTGKSWETLLVNRIFIPLGIEHYGFGPVGLPDDLLGEGSEQVDESGVPYPWGHVVDQSPGKTVGRAIAALASGGTKTYEHRPVQVDNAPPLGPAGRVHMPIGQWCKFIRVFLDEIAAPGSLAIDAEDWSKLFDPGSEGRYAGGWIVMQRDWADGRAIMHNGSNTTWYCVAWVAPKNKIINLAATNCYDPNSQKACENAVAALFKLAATLESAALEE